MAITYPTGCDTLLDGHVRPLSGEHGRVRGVAFYDSDYTFTDLSTILPKVGCTHCG